MTRVAGQLNLRFFEFFRRLQIKGCVGRAFAFCARKWLDVYYRIIGHPQTPIAHIVDIDAQPTHSIRPAMCGLIKMATANLFNCFVCSAAVVTHVNSFVLQTGFLEEEFVGIESDIFV